MRTEAQKERDRKYRETHRAKRAAVAREYWHTVKKHIPLTEAELEYRREWQRKNNQTEHRKAYMREYMREYSKTHRAEIRERTKARRNGTRPA